MQAYTIIIIPTLIKCKCLFTMMSNNKHLSLVTCHLYSNKELKFLSAQMQELFIKIDINKNKPECCNESSIK